MVVGNAACGKTSIIKRFVDNVFSETYKSTVGADFSRKIIQWDEVTTVSSAHRFSRLLSSDASAIRKAVARKEQTVWFECCLFDLRLSEPLWLHETADTAAALGHCRAGPLRRGDESIL